MQISDVIDLWPVVYASIREFWRLLEAPIEEAATRLEIPVELYSYGELGLDDFSVAAFQKRDPYSNPASFLSLFTRLAAQGWVAQVGEHQYQVTEQARSAARQIVRSGYEVLSSLDVLPAPEEDRLALLLSRLVESTRETPEPPEKWAFLHRFRVATAESPLLAQVSEHILDLFAYRDDVHLAAWKRYGVSGPSWNAFTSLWRGEVTTPAQVAEQAAFRGYTAHDYEAAIQNLCQRGWVEEASLKGSYRVTEQGQALRDGVEQRTDDAFYAPWSCLQESEIVELRVLLVQLLERLQTLPKEAGEQEK